jgi:hypothetical protein
MNLVPAFEQWAAEKIAEGEQRGEERQGIRLPVGC